MESIEGQDLELTLQLSTGETLDTVLQQKKLEDMKPSSHTMHHHH